MGDRLLPKIMLKRTLEENALSEQLSEDEVSWELPDGFWLAGTNRTGALNRSWILMADQISNPVLPVINFSIDDITSEIDPFAQFRNVGPAWFCTMPFSFRPKVHPKTWTSIAHNKLQPCSGVNFHFYRQYTKQKIIFMQSEDSSFMLTSNMITIRVSIGYVGDCNFYWNRLWRPTDPSNYIAQILNPTPPCLATSCRWLTFQGLALF